MLGDDAVLDQDGAETLMGFLLFSEGGTELILGDDPRIDQHVAESFLFHLLSPKTAKAPYPLSGRPAFSQYSLPVFSAASLLSASSSVRLRESEEELFSITSPSVVVAW